MLLPFKDLPPAIQRQIKNDMLDDGEIYDKRGELSPIELESYGEQYIGHHSMVPTLNAGDCMLCGCKVARMDMTPDNTQCNECCDEAESCQRANTHRMIALFGRE